MNSSGIHATLCTLVIAAFSAGCAVEAQDMDDAPASAEPALSEQDFPPLHPPTCPDIDLLQFRPQFCPAGPMVQCTRECTSTRHWSVIQQQCVIDTTTCGAWDCPPCL